MPPAESPLALPARLRHYFQFLVFGLILAEALILCLLAATLGLAASRALYPIVVKATGFRLTAGPIFGTGLG